MGKSFETAAKKVAPATDEEKAESGEWWDFDIVEKAPDGSVIRTQKCWAQKPDDGQIAITMAQMGRFSRMSDRVGGAIDLLMAVVDEPSMEYLSGRLMDRADPFGLEELQPIFRYLIEEWGGHPTQ